uniref:pilus assembly protein n=1 Tax=Variovorax sp. KK3 TaxID=1855728 RepID=UPI0015C32D17
MTMRRIWPAWMLVCMLAGVEAGADVSQLPLTGGASAVPPNLMFTIDDSGSMSAECVPDDICTGYYGRASSYRVAAIPDPVGVTASYNGFVATYASDSLFGVRMRSSATNAIYYNPAVRYRPWMQADGTRYPEYPAREAPGAPNKLTPRANLVASQSLTRKWSAEASESDYRNTASTAKIVWPAQYYELKSGKPGTSVADFTQVYITSDRKEYPKGVQRTDCAGVICTYEEEAQNFSNWYTYARNRLQMVKSGTFEVLNAVPPSVRVGFAAINSEALTNIDGVATSTILLGVRPFSGPDQAAFYKKLQDHSTYNLTPLRRALDDVGRYFSRADKKSPWATDPSNGEPPTDHKSCRRSFNILLTDGRWNDAAATTPGANADVDNNDGLTITHADGKTTFKYKPEPPYRGVSAPSLADVAMYYWNRDLRPDLKNDVPVGSSDPAFWQHLVNHTIGLGLTGELRNPEDWALLVEGKKGWGTPLEDNAATVDDLWHAAVNSRGSTAAVQSLASYSGALKSMVDSIVIGSGGSESGVAVSGRTYSPTAVKYIPSYKSGSWAGEVEARNLSDGKVLWQASKQFPKFEDRKIYTLNSEDSTAVAFTVSDLSSATQSALQFPEPAKLIAYIRGDQTEEKNTYRRRESLLGDIVNSSPVLVKDLVDSQYDFLDPSIAGKTSYLRYFNSKASREAQLFVGANDGMLHAFNANSGAESFAFIPRSVHGRLKDLVNPLYDHRYFVDGPLTEVDVHDNTAVKWRNLVVGSGGAGAKNLFAINVPVPTLPAKGDPTKLDAAASAPTAKDILWEISSDQTDYREMGHVLQAPEAGIMQDGSWVVIAGNGFGSANNRGTLYIIDALTGARLAALDTGSGSVDSPAGLGGVKLVRDATKRVVAAYAGDLQGQLWKFDLSSATRSQWRVAFGGKPLFTARYGVDKTLAITAAPTILPHPLGGNMVMVGTGRLFEGGDAVSETEQRLYGVWDKVRSGSGSEADVLSNDDTLVEQTIADISINGASGRFFSVTNKGVDYGSGASAKKRGWLIRMSIAKGQRMIDPAQIRSGRVIFDTMVPGGVSADCKVAGPQGYAFVLDPFTGAPGREAPTFDTNGDGLFTSADNATVAIVRVASTGGNQVVGR